MGSDTIALISLGIAIVGLIGGSIVRDRQIFKAIHDGDDKTKELIKEGDRELKSSLELSINKLSDVVRESHEQLGHRINSGDEKIHTRVNDAVTRTELNGKLIGIQGSVDKLSQRIDTVLTTMASNK